MDGWIDGWMEHTLQPKIKTLNQAALESLSMFCIVTGEKYNSESKDDKGSFDYNDKIGNNKSICKSILLDLIVITLPDMIIDDET